MKTGTQKRWQMAGLAAVVALALGGLAVAVVTRPGPGGSIGYTGSSANPSLGGPVALAPAAQRKPAPELAFHRPDGTVVRLADLKGHAVLVNLWATWCPPCVAEMPSLDKLAAKLDGARFQVVTVSLDQGGSAVAHAWLAQHGLTHLPADHADPAAFPDAMLPHSMLIDAQGRLAWDGLGGRAWDSQEVVAVVRSLAKEGG